MVLKIEYLIFKMRIPAALRQIFCTFKVLVSNCCGRLNTCSLDHPIDTEDYVLGSELDTTVEQFDVRNKEDIKFLPGKIGEKFPNLKEFQVVNCGLTALRNHYFKDMRNLKILYLNDNKITTIEADAFQDLISVSWLNLSDNMIETLDEKTFATMVSLEDLWLSRNKIKVMSSKTLQIPGGKLNEVYFWSNVCIDSRYYSSQFNKLDSDITVNCSREIKSGDSGAITFN